MVPHNHTCPSFYCPIEKHNPGRTNAPDYPPEMPERRKDMKPEEMTAEDMSPEEVAIMRSQVAAEVDADEPKDASPVVSDTKPAVSQDDYSGNTDPGTGDSAADTDQWSGIDPSLRLRFEELSAKIEGFGTTETRLKQAESRIGALTNQLRDAAAAKAPGQQATGPDLPSQGQMDAAANSTAEWKELEADFPEWAKAIDQRISALKAEIGTSPQSPTPGISRDDINAEIDSALEIRALTREFPDWKSTVKTASYKEWLPSLPPTEQAKHNSPKADDAIDLLRAFHKSRGTAKTATEIAEERRQRLITAQTPQGKSLRGPKAEADLTEAEFRQHAAKEIWSS